MNRLRLARSLAAVIGVVVLGACAPPGTDELAIARTPRLDGRAAWNAFTATVPRVNLDLSSLPGAPCGGYRADLRIYAVDTACLARRTSDLRINEAVEVHELAHAADQQVLGFIEGVGPCRDVSGGTICEGFEKGAQCIAEVVLGYSPPIGHEDLGYWSCPPDEIVRTRDAMERAGLW